VWDLAGLAPGHVTVTETDRPGEPRHIMLVERRADGVFVVAETHSRPDQGEGNRGFGEFELSPGELGGLPRLPRALRGPLRVVQGSDGKLAQVMVRGGTRGASWAVRGGGRDHGAGNPRISAALSAPPPGPVPLSRRLPVDLVGRVDFPFIMLSLLEELRLTGLAQYLKTMLGENRMGEAMEEMEELVEAMANQISALITREKRDVHDAAVNIKFRAFPEGTGGNEEILTRTAGILLAQGISNKFQRPVYFESIKICPADA
jgi:hypothetical protein